VRVLSARYAASAWRFDRAQESMPPHYAGTAHEWLWLAFTSGAPMPIGERQLRNILPAPRPRPPAGPAGAIVVAEEGAS
jgi:hypothetical protein